MARAQANSRWAFRFRLRSLFVLVATAGVVSGIARSLIQGDHALSYVFVGLGVFCYGGVAAIPCYAFVAALMVITTKTTWGQRAGEIFAAVVGAAVWMSFIFAILKDWPLVCTTFSLVIAGIMVGLVKTGWTIPEGPAPEGMLKRLLATKKECQQTIAQPRS
jgi:hypothetical protein